ncbi:acyl-CoA dehydrogenase family protein [Deinococcus sonorensis]|uniref:Acyl-CoA dehydrogenase family protein n=2 Tax=Deinococcus sonorensis TaxID=309891 RepID=A0AAU7UG08_9DEIO
MTSTEQATRQDHLNALTGRLAEVFAAQAAHADRNGRLSEAGVQALRESGYPALTVPQRLGGLGASLYEFAVQQERLGRADASLALVAAMNAHLLGSLGEQGGLPEPLYAELARASVQRGALSNSLASEPELGSPSRGGLPATRAEPVPGGWRVTGRKTWSTGSSALDYLVVTAATPADEVWRFVIPADREGVRVLPTWEGSLALRGSASDDVQLDRVWVPDSHAVRPAAPNPLGGGWFWTAVAATYLGVGQAALDALVTYAHQRVPTALGAPIATLPRIQQTVGQMQLTLLGARSVLHAATQGWAGAPQERERLLPQLAGAKLLCTNAAVQVTDLALRAAGGAALTAALPLERLFRDARAGLTHPPGDDQGHTLLGRAALNL